MTGNLNPLRIVPQIPEIIESKPSLVIIGITYRDIISDEVYPMDFIYGGENIYLDPEARSFFNASELKYLNVGDFDYFAYKVSLLQWIVKYELQSSVKRWLNIDVKLIPLIPENSVKDPYTMDLRKNVTTNYKGIAEGAKNPNDEWRPVVTDTMDRSKRSLLYDVKKLRDNNISVILVNLPLHPLYSAKITNESRKNYFDLLNMTGVNYYDYEKTYPEAHFFDSHHATWGGALNFSEEMVILLKKEGESGAFYHH